MVDSDEKQYYIEKAKRICTALDSIAIKGVDVAEDQNVSVQAVSKWRRTGRISNENLKGIANLTDYSFEWLSTGTGNALHKQNTDIRTRSLPLLHPSQIKSYIDGSLHLNVIPQWIDTSVVTSERSFVVKINDDTMANPSDHRSIPKGANVVIDSEIEAQNNQVVAVLFIESSEVLIKEYYKDGPNYYFSSFNSKYQPIKSSVDEFEILGVAKRVEYDL